MIVGSISRRYARALIGLAEEKELVEEIGRQLSDFAGILRQHHEALAILSEPLIPESERKSLVKSLAEKIGLHPWLLHFLYLMVEKERMAIIGDVDREYRQMHDEKLGWLRVEVVSADEPDPQFLHRIEKTLAKKLQKKIVARGERQADLMGGILLKMGHLVCDASIRHELEVIKQKMLQAQL